MSKCPVFWGSHGCDKPRDHEGRHVCWACCGGFAADDPSHAERHATAPDGYGFEGCAGNWPYYGRKNMAGKTEHGLTFFIYEAPDWRFVYLPDEFDRMAAMREETP